MPAIPQQLRFHKKWRIAATQSAISYGKPCKPAVRPNPYPLWGLKAKRHVQKPRRAGKGNNVPQGDAGAGNLLTHHALKVAPLPLALLDAPALFVSPRSHAPAQAGAAFHDSLCGHANLHAPICPPCDTSASIYCIIRLHISFHNTYWVTIHPQIMKYHNGRS